MTTDREVERAAVVAWLRDAESIWSAKRSAYQAAGHFGPYLGSPSFYSIADAIERGEHLGGGDA